MEKSDVYSFGVLLLEVVTVRKQLERVQYIVRVMKAANIRLVPASIVRLHRHCLRVPPDIIIWNRIRHVGITRGLTLYIELRTVWYGFCTTSSGSCSEYFPTKRPNRK